MKKRRLLFVVPFGFFVIFSGAVLLFYFANPDNPLDPPSQRILGSWTTSILLSELGPTISFVSFKEDGTYKWTGLLLYLWTSETGTYRIAEDKLILFSSGEASNKTFSFQKNVLIIIEKNGYEHHFRKIFKP